MNNAANLKGFRLRQSFERSRTSPRPGAAAGREDMRVGIIGIGMTAFRPSTPEYNWKELMFEAASRAYADAAINPREDVDSFITCAEDYYEGFGIFDEFVPDQLGAALRPTCTVSGDGLQGLANAYMQIQTGLLESRGRLRRPRPRVGSRREETSFEPRLDSWHRVGQRLPEPRDAGLDRGHLRPDRRRHGLPLGEGPTTGHGHRLCGGRRPLLVQGASASRIPWAREKGRGGDEGPSRRLRRGWPLPGECLGRFPRMRKRVRGDRTPPGRGGRPPASRRRRSAATRRRPGGRRAVVAVRPERDRRRGRPGGGAATKGGGVGAGLTLFRRRVPGTREESCLRAPQRALD